MNNPSPLACGLDLESFKSSTITLVESPSKFVPDLLVADVGGYCIYVD